MNPILVCENISKNYQSTVAVNNLSISVSKGEIISILGSSGCGKTTLLRLIAGFVKLDRGEIKLKNIVQLSGRDQHVDFQEQTTTKTDEGTIRPDMLVNLPNGGIIVIDAKSPYKAFLESIEQDDPDRIRWK